MRRRYTSDSDESPLSSSLTTPVEEEPQPFDQILIQGALDNPSDEELQLASLTPRASSYHMTGKSAYDTHSTPKTPRSLSKGFMKAKQFAKSIGKGTLRGSAKVRPTLLAISKTQPHVFRGRKSGPFCCRK
jgi:hypothetical protein